MHCLFKNMQFVIKIHSSVYCTEPMKALSTCSLDNLKRKPFIFTSAIRSKIINVTYKGKNVYGSIVGARPSRHPLPAPYPSIKKGHITHHTSNLITMLSRPQLTTSQHHTKRTQPFEESH